MTLLRIAFAAIVMAALYLSLAAESVAGGRTLLPHAPSAAIVLAAWSLSMTPAVLIAALVGVCCDAIGTGLLGPGIVAAIAAVLVSSTLKQRWELESPLAAVLFGMGVAGTFLAGPLVVTSVLNDQANPVALLHLQIARAISSAMAAAGLIVAARVASRLIKGATGVLLNV